MKSTTSKKTKKVRVIPGYHLTLGITVTMLSLIVLIPLAFSACICTEIVSIGIFSAGYQTKHPACLPDQHSVFPGGSADQLYIWSDHRLGVGEIRFSMQEDFRWMH